MSYTPTPGIFVNGRIADAVEVLNEFSAISVATKENATKIESATQKQLQASKTYTDTELGKINVDGGSF